MKKGFLNLVLHAHLPYVHHPEHESFYEERWLFEAITGCYLPLAQMLDRLQNEHIDFRLTLSISPTLLTLLQDELLYNRYLKHLISQLELAEKELHRTQGHPHYQSLALYYRDLFKETYRCYVNQYDGDLLAVFKKHCQTGKLELITTAATHGFLPLLNINPVAVYNQINTGLQAFETYFGFRPEGFWLPECAFYPGLEKILKDAGISYFFVDTHGITQATHPPIENTYSPLDCGNDVMAFGRDQEASHQVWSAESGYPGDPDYREFYSDIGYELDLEYIAPYILDQSIRINTGIKYHKITPQHAEKQPYDPQTAANKARIHAEHFIEQRCLHVQRLNGSMPRPPIFVAPYDAELFGHWWFEGPQWLEQVLRIAARDDNAIVLSTPKEYLQRYPEQQVALPATSSWGENGYSSYWINENNQWIYPLIHKAADDLENLVNEVAKYAITPLQERALNQAMRSVLLMQASDWPFLLKSGTAREYAHKRITDQLARFNYLFDSIRQNNIDERYLTALEIMDDIFPDIDFRTYRAT